MPSQPATPQPPPAVDARSASAAARRRRGLAPRSRGRSPTPDAAGHRDAGARAGDRGAACSAGAAADRASCPAPPAPPPPTASDLASYIEQRRRARGETGDAPATVDSDSARRDRAIAQNLASLSTSTFGEAPQNGGGTFQIRRLDYDDAQFTFYGWSKEINRRTFQVIDVRSGSNENISIAIVRKIISIIREYEPGDFRWHSQRLARDLTLSARPEDNAELEKFMMQEFFNDAGRAR